MIHRKKIVLSLLLVNSILYASEYNKNKQKFDKKYLDKNSASYQDGINFEKKNNYKVTDLVQLNKDGKKLSKELHKSSFDGSNNTSKNKSRIIASQINIDVRSKTYKDEINKYKDFILEDKAFNISQNLGKYKDVVKDIKKNDYANVPYKNKFLNYDERLIIAISSSIPKETIKTYIEDLSKVATDVQFVLRGFLGNDARYAMPTMKYIKNLLKKDDKNYYKANIGINPKIFSKYNLKQAPAVLFIKNYNPFNEIQGNNYNEDLGNEEIFISYGDNKIEYALEKINNKAKSKGLAKLIVNMKKGFFNEKN